MAYRKSNKIILSYTTLNMIYTKPHGWLNKQAKIPKDITPETQAIFDEGKLSHSIVQAYVSGKPVEQEKRVTDILTAKLRNIQFPIVEEKDFDERCKFTLDFGDYEFIGFFDGQNPAEKRFMEGKFSSRPWNLVEFKNAMQRKVYSLAKPEYEEAILVTAPRHPKDWTKTNFKVLRVPNTEEDRVEAKEWILKGIELIEGDPEYFLSDLQGGVKCTDPWCDWGNNCLFR